MQGNQGMYESNTFDPLLVDVLVDGHYITGFSDSTVLEVTRNEDTVSPKTGIKGDTGYAINRNRSGKAKMTLMSTSASIPLLARIANNATPVSLVIRNSNPAGGFMIQHSRCMVLKVPDFKIGKEVEDIEIEMYIPEANYQ